jgi:predicted DNA-binding transcriptional regulator
VAEEVTEELKAQIVEYLTTKSKMMTLHDIARGLSLEHRITKKAITELVNAGTLEFESFGGATFIKIAEKQE